MNIVYFSNFLSPHVKPFCDTLYKLLNNEFKFVQTMPLSNERRRLGYNKSTGEYVIDLTNRIKDLKIEANKADCAIFTLGSVPYEIITERIKNNKLTFFMSERLFKRGMLKILDIKLWKQLYINIISRNKNVYLLCNGCYVAKDFKIIGFNFNNCFKFGYFPESGIENYNKIFNPIDQLKLLWVGRMIDWKRPELAIEIARLCSLKIYTELTFIGDGYLFDRLQTKCKKIDSQKCKIIFLGLKNNQIVRQYMKQSDFLLMTSNRREGWGAVVNESLSEGLPVIAEKSIGSSEYLIENGKTGYLFNSKDLISISNNIIRKKIDDSKKMYKECYEKIRLWNGELAAERFFKIASSIYEKNVWDYYKDGPMSKA